MSTHRARRIVYDAGVIIAIFETRDPHNYWARQLQRNSYRLERLASVLTLSESIVRAAGDGQGPGAMTALHRLRIVPITLGQEDIVPLAELRARSRLRMPDAVVLHTAIRERAAIATTDARLARIARERGVEAHAPDDDADDIA